MASKGAKKGATTGAPKVISGRLTAGVQLQPTPEQLEVEHTKQLARRRLEHELIGKLDKRGITNLREDCWFLMDAQWIAKWMLYVQAGLTAAETTGQSDAAEAMTTTTTTTAEPLPLPPAPGPVSSSRLLDLDVAPTSAPLPLPGLHAVNDYRGVPSLVYFAFVELHGKDGSPELARYAVDIYMPAVPIERLMPIRYRAQTTSRILVDKIRPAWLTWERHYSDDENEIDDNGRSPVCCCGLTRDHIETLIYWAVLCCTRASRSSSGRKNISYRKYKPLKYQAGDSTHGDSPQKSREETDTVTTADEEEEEESDLDGVVEEHGKDYHQPFLKGLF